MLPSGSRLSINRVNGFRSKFHLSSVLHHNHPFIILVTFSPVSFFHDHASIDYSEKYSSTETYPDQPAAETELYQRLLSDGFSHPLLPAPLYYMEYSNYQSSDDFVSQYVSFICEETIHISIERYSDPKYIGTTDVVGNFTASKKILVDGVDIYLFERDGGSDSVSTTLTYMTGLTQYDINLQYCSIDKAEAFVSELR